MKALAALYCVTCGLTPMLCAQEPSLAAPTPPPSQPFLEKAPEFAQWIVTSMYVETVADKSTSAEASPTSASPTPSKVHGHRSIKAVVESTESTPSLNSSEERKTSVTKTKTIRYERITATGVDDIERWCLPDIQITVQKGGATTVSLPSDARNSSYVDYSQTDFTGFDWLSPSNFKGIEQVNGQECYVFHEKAKEQRGNSNAPLERTACINADTRLPVTLQEDDELLTFHFDVAPTAILRPPPDVMARVEEWKKSVRQSEMMPTKP